MSELNVFSALGIDDDEAVVAALRTDLAGIVRGYIDRSNLSQTALARKLGIPQSTISAIKNDKIDKLSIEYFVRILTRIKIPWSAKCWTPPHDAQWIAGGISQLLASVSNMSTFQSSEPAESVYWQSSINEDVIKGLKVYSEESTTNKARDIATVEQSPQH